MAPMLELLLVFLCAGTTTSEVNDNFNNCKQDFFYQGTPPAVSYPGELREKSICQKYNNVYHFATLYSIRYRIPIYSAYRLPLGNCQGEQPKRRDNWFIEPQLLDNGGGQSPMMRTSGSRDQINEYKINQAINEDYRNTGFDRGHLNPNFYHCNDGRTATFTLTNAVPQNACFNELIWFAMEGESKTIMNTLCSFDGARRFFITGTVPYRRTIPNRGHDLEGDNRNRGYNRVSVPSHMWTAVCCDSTGAKYPADRNKGFSFGYMGENKADGSVDAFSVRELENSISSIPPVGRSIKIFVNDYCNENSDNSKKALSRIQSVIAKTDLNSQDKLSMTDLSQLPFKRRRLDSGEFQIISSQGKQVLFDLTLGVELANQSQAVNNYRNKLKSSSHLTVIMTGFDQVAKANSKVEFDTKSKKFSLHENQMAITKRKKVGYRKNRALRGAENRKKILTPGRKEFGKHNLINKAHRVHMGQYLPKNGFVNVSSFKSVKHKHVKSSIRSSTKEKSADDPVAVVDTYMFAPELSAADMTVGGDYCRSDHKCDFHKESYKWCYWNINDDWDYCCNEDCKSSNLQDFTPTCDVGNGTIRDCSMRSSIITVTGGRCRQDHECGLHQNSYYWCYTDFHNNWQYCCQPWHRCDYYNESYKWCYAGSSLASKWKNCYY